MTDKNSWCHRTLKCILGFGIVLVSAQARALDFTPDASRVLADPAYMPERGQIYGSTIYAYGKRSGDVIYPYQNTQDSSFTVRSNTLTQSLDYGVIDTLSVQVNVAYERDSNQYDFTNGTIVNVDARGFKNPSFGVKLRVLEQDDDGVNWDWIGTYIPSVIPAKEPTRTRDGTVAHGGPQGNLGTAVSFKTKSFTAYVIAEASYLGKSEDQITEYQTNTYEPSVEYFFGLNTQTRVNEVFAINLGVSETIRNSTHVSAWNGYNTATFDFMPGNVTRVNAAMVWRIVPETLAGIVSYDHDIHESSRYTNVMPPFVAPQLDSAVRNESANSISVSLLYASD